MKFKFVLFEKERNRKIEMKNESVKILKAQMSLEMIIGLLILVVVAAVVIRTFFTSMATIDDLSALRQTADYKQFQSLCQGYCREYATSGNLGAAVAFCTTRLFPEGTRNKLGKPGDVDVISPETRGANVFFLRPWDVCEDAIFCFHVFDCREYATLTIEDCRKILCEYYGELYRDPFSGSMDYNRLGFKITEIFKGKARNTYGSCRLVEDTNWWTRYFGQDFQGICRGVV